MRITKNVRPLLLVGLVIGACSHASNTSRQNTLGSAVIGPEGGEIVVASGEQAGLRLTVPSGAIAEPTTIEIVDASLTPEPSPLIAPATVGLGAPFVLEPRELRLDVPATLRLPYRVRDIAGTGAGNVRARQLRNGNAIDHEPTTVDVSAAWMEVPVRTFARFQAVRGPVVGDITTYWQQAGQVIELSGGRSFATEPVPGPSPFESPTAVRWRLDGPEEEALLYFDGVDLRGRESVTDGWRELWAQPYSIWTNGPAAVPAGGLTTNATITMTSGTTSSVGSVTTFGSWSWSGPRTVAGRRLFDIARLTVSVAWQRVDIGVGQVQYEFWFAPGIGLVGYSEDGVVFERLVL
jgi:hypothetical protein